MEPKNSSYIKSSFSWSASFSIESPTQTLYQGRPENWDLPEKSLLVGGVTSNIVTALVPNEISWWPGVNIRRMGWWHLCAKLGLGLWGWGLGEGIIRLQNCCRFWGLFFICWCWGLLIQTEWVSELASGQNPQSGLFLYPIRLERALSSHHGLVIIKIIKMIAIKEG